MKVYDPEISKLCVGAASLLTQRGAMTVDQLKSIAGWNKVDAHRVIQHMKRANHRGNGEDCPAIFHWKHDTQLFLSLKLGSSYQINTGVMKILHSGRVSDCDECGDRYRADVLMYSKKENKAIVEGQRHNGYDPRKYQQNKAARGYAILSQTVAAQEQRIRELEEAVYKQRIPVNGGPDGVLQTAVKLLGTSSTSESPLSSGAPRRTMIKTLSGLINADQLGVVLDGDKGGGEGTYRVSVGNDSGALFSVTSAEVVALTAARERISVKEAAELLGLA